MKNIIIVQNSLKTVLLFRVTYIKKLLNRGFNVIVIAPNDCVESKCQLISLGVKVISIPQMNSFASKIKAMMLMNYYIVLYRFKKSSFISHFLITFIICYPTLVLFNKHLVVFIEGLGSLFSNKKVFQKLARFLLNRNQGVSLFSNNDEKCILGRNSDSVTNGIGINLSRFSPVLSKKNSNEFNLIYVGRLIKDKGILDAIEVLKNLIDKGFNVKLNIIGDIYKNNPSSLNLSQIDEYKIEFGDAINFVGFTNDVVTWYKKSDILLLPSRREGFPVCVMEANSMGIPAVGYNVSGVNTAIKSNINGLLAMPFCSNDLSDNVCSLLNRDILNSYRDKCVKYANDNFDADIKADELLIIVENI